MICCSGFLVLFRFWLWAFSYALVYVIPCFHSVCCVLFCQVLPGCGDFFSVQGVLHSNSLHLQLCLSWVFIQICRVLLTQLNSFLLILVISFLTVKQSIYCLLQFFLIQIMILWYYSYLKLCPIPSPIHQLSLIILCFLVICLISFFLCHLSSGYI